MKKINRIIASIISMIIILQSIQSAFAGEIPPVGVSSTSKAEVEAQVANIKASSWDTTQYPSDLFNRIWIDDVIEETQKTAWVPKPVYKQVDYIIVPEKTIYIDIPHEEVFHMEEIRAGYYDIKYKTIGPTYKDVKVLVKEGYTQSISVWVEPTYKTESYVKTPASSMSVQDKYIPTEYGYRQVKEYYTETVKKWVALPAGNGAGYYKYETVEKWRYVSEKYVVKDGYWTYKTIPIPAVMGTRTVVDVAGHYKTLTTTIPPVYRTDSVIDKPAYDVEVSRTWIPPVTIKVVDRQAYIEKRPQVIPAVTEKRDSSEIDHYESKEVSYTDYSLKAGTGYWKYELKQFSQAEKDKAIADLYRLKVSVGKTGVTASTTEQAARLRIIIGDSSYGASQNAEEYYNANGLGAKGVENLHDEFGNALKGYYNLFSLDDIAKSHIADYQDRINNYLGIIGIEGFDKLDKSAVASYIGKTKVEIQASMNTLKKEKLTSEYELYLSQYNQMKSIPAVTMLQRITKLMDIKEYYEKNELAKYGISDKHSIELGQLEKDLSEYERSTNEFLEVDKYNLLVMAYKEVGELNDIVLNLQYDLENNYPAGKSQYDKDLLLMTFKQAQLKKMIAALGGPLASQEFNLLCNKTIEQRTHKDYTDLAATLEVESEYFLKETFVRGTEDGFTAEIDGLVDLYKGVVSGLEYIELLKTDVEVQRELMEVVVAQGPMMMRDMLMMLTSVGFNYQVSKHIRDMVVSSIDKISEQTPQYTAGYILGSAAWNAMGAIVGAAVGGIVKSVLAKVAEAGIFPDVKQLMMATFKSLKARTTPLVDVTEEVIDLTPKTKLEQTDELIEILNNPQSKVEGYDEIVDEIADEAIKTSNLATKLDNIVDGTGALNQGVVDEVVSDIVGLANKGELTDDVAVKALDALEAKHLPELDDEILDIKEAAEVAMNGDQYTKVNRLKTLKGDISYQTAAGHLYKTDSLGRIDSAEGTLKLATAKRNSYAQSVAGRTDRLADDHGGHLIASIFNGSGDLDNLVPMNGNLNQGEWKAMENVWAKALGEGKEVKVSIDVLYEGTSLRPSEFYIDYYIDGVKFEEVFENIAGGGL